MNEFDELKNKFVGLMLRNNIQNNCAQGQTYSTAVCCSSATLPPFEEPMNSKISQFTQKCQQQHTRLTQSRLFNWWPNNINKTQFLQIKRYEAKFPEFFPVALGDGESTSC